MEKDGKITSVKDMLVLLWTIMSSVISVFFASLKNANPDVWTNPDYFNRDNLVQLFNPGSADEPTCSEILKQSKNIEELTGEIDHAPGQHYMLILHDSDYIWVRKCHATNFNDEFIQRFTSFPLTD
jgi:hypothetical protein